MEKKNTWSYSNPRKRPDRNLDMDSLQHPPVSEVPILTFHKVDSRFEFGVTRITPGGFRKVIAFLKREGYETVSLETLCDPETVTARKPIVLTFDDSYESLYDNAFPILQEFGFTATIFVVTGYVGTLNAWDVNLGWILFRHLSWGQLEEFRKASFEIGSHTVHHPDLTRISGEKLRSELEDSKKTIEDRLGAPIRFVSFPFGRYNDSVLETMKECGYERGVGFWLREQSDKALVFKRKAYYLFDGLWNLKAKLGHNPLTVLEDFKLRLVNFCSHGTALVKPHRE
jgi:peptidoglycan/xylan/chitin deacetylase (PgdA/CDA1 family)